MFVDMHMLWHACGGLRTTVGVSPSFHHMHHQAWWEEPIPTEQFHYPAPQDLGSGKRM